MKTLSAPWMRYALTVVLIVVLFAVGYGIGTVATTPQAPPTPTSGPAGAAMVQPPYQVQDFTLTSDGGEPIRLSDLRGKPTLLFFGYTHCPDVCPTTLANFKRVKEALGPNGDDVSFVFVSVDGQRDTPEVVREYLDQFDPSFIGMTGSESDLQAIGRQFGVYAERENVPLDDNHSAAHSEELDSDNYFVSHTSPSFLIDSEGMLRLVYFYGAEPSAIAEGIRGML